MRHHRDVMADPLMLSQVDADSEPDVMSGLSNLADCMLVIICGLMVAFFMHWNISTSGNYEQIEISDAMVEVDSDVGKAQNSDDSDAGFFERAGSVYRDTKTGKMYYLLDE